MLGPIVLIWQIQKKIPHNVATLGYFCPPKKKPLYLWHWRFLLLLGCKTKPLVPAGSQNIKGFLIFVLSYLVFSQIWLNLLVDHLFRYNTKLGEKKKP